MAMLSKPKATRLAVAFLVACVNSSEADGHQAHEGSDFHKYEPTIEYYDDCLTVLIDGRRVRFTADTE